MILQLDAPPVKTACDETPTDDDRAWFAGLNTYGDEDGPDWHTLMTVSALEWWTENCDPDRNVNMRSCE